MAVIMTGVLMTAVDTTIVVLALPEIQRGLHVDLSAVVWVIISFLLVITLLATQVGRLGDMFGRVRMYQQRRGDRRPVPARAAGQGLRLHLRRLDHGCHHRHRARRRDRHLYLLAVAGADRRVRPHRAPSR